MFQVSMPNVRVTVPYVGGAFGGKSYFKIEPLAVALARTAGGRPVRLAQSASESMLTIRRHSARCRVRTGVRRDGTVVAREAELHLDTGAYADNGPRVAKRVATRIHGPYRIPNYRIDVYYAVYTNTAPAGSMRSIGGPQSIFPLESHMDDIAPWPGDRSAGVPPQEPAAPRRATQAGGQAHGRGPCTWACARSAPWLDGMRNGAPPADNLGIAVGVTDSEAMPVSTAILRLLSDGSVVLMAGSTEVGQGARTVLSQVAAEGPSTAAGAHRHARHQHRRDPVRPLHRRQPLDHGHGDRRQVRGRGPCRADPDGGRGGHGLRAGRRDPGGRLGRSRRATHGLRRGGAGVLRHARRGVHRPGLRARRRRAFPTSSRCSGKRAWAPRR